jgi:dATP pyrophosphohydrolase
MAVLRSRSWCCPTGRARTACSYALFRRADADCWQGVAGGGEADESPLQAARREAAEEAGPAGDSEFVVLDAWATIPVVYVTGEFTWGPDVLVIPEYAFGARVDDAELTLSHEHTEYGWFTLDAAAKAVQWDSNRTALWELDHRLRHGTVHRAARATSPVTPEPNTRAVSSPIRARRARPIPRLHEAADGAPARGSRARRRPAPP